MLDDSIAYLTFGSLCISMMLGNPNLQGTLRNWVTTCLLWRTGVLLPEDLSKYEK